LTKIKLELIRLDAKVMGPSEEVTFGGDKSVDDSVKNGPAEFREHLNAVWERVVTEPL